MRLRGAPVTSAGYPVRQRACRASAALLFAGRPWRGQRLTLTRLAAAFRIARPDVRGGLAVAVRISGVGPLAVRAVPARASTLDVRSC